MSSGTIKHELKKILSIVFYKIQNKYEFSENEKRDILKYFSDGNSFDEWKNTYIQKNDCGCMFLNLESLEFNLEYAKFIHNFLNSKQWRNVCNCGNTVCANCQINICEQCCGVKRGYFPPGFYSCKCVNITNNIANTCIDCIKSNPNYKTNIKYIGLTEEERRKEMIQALQTFNITLRDDSILCNTFISEGILILGSVEKTARRMAEMQFLYDFTAYPDLVCFYDKEYSEFTALRETGGFPEIFPWNVSA